MSSPPLTVSSLTYIHPTTLAALLSSPSTASSVAVVDVRDSDHIGGHIKSSSWIPIAELEARIPELLRIHGDKDKVVFHCMLSQQRGPSAALRFARAKQALEGTKRAQGWKMAKVEAEEESVQNREEGEAQGGEQKKGPEVCVLEGGFVAWQARYGEDGKLTEGYVKDLWE